MSYFMIISDKFKMNLERSSLLSAILKIATKLLTSSYRRYINKSTMDNTILGDFCNEPTKKIILTTLRKMPCTGFCARM